MDKKPSVVINIEHQQLSTILKILNQVSSGESSPTFIEERVMELKKYVPFLSTAIALMAIAMERVSESKNKVVKNDTDTLREFLNNLDALCVAQGVLAALLCVGESLRTDDKRKIPVSKSTPKKTKKENRNVGKRNES